MVQRPIAMSAIAPVAVAAILILGILAAISTTKQAFAQPKEKFIQTWFTRENGKSYVCKRNIHEPGHGHCTLLYEKPTPPPAPAPVKTGGEEYSACMRLKGKMANDEAAAEQYKSKDCESLLKVGTGGLFARNEEPIKPKLY